jgi:hypothetical protein
MSQKVLDAIRDFVAGRSSPAEFRASLHGDPAAYEAFLSNDPQLDSANYVQVSVFRFIMGEDLTTFSGTLNAQGALVDFLERNGILHTKTRRYQDLYQLILSALPEWLDVDPSYVYDHILPAAEGRKGPELAVWLKHEFRERFRYVPENPPEWIQEPCWPINENGPMVLLGQLDINHYFHDDARVYVFYDPKTGAFENVLQVS